jgi:hypothetical protein
MSDIEFIVFAAVFLAGCYIWREGRRLFALLAWGLSVLLAWYLWQ